MIINNLVNEKVKEQGFEYLGLNWDKELGVLTYKKNQIILILKAYYDSEVTNKEIINDIIKIRNNLEKKTQFNIWNSYVLVCLNTSYESYIDLVMKVEKDTTALRKYVIYNENDLKRIPFLDDTCSENLKIRNIFEDIEFDNLESIQEIVDYTKQISLVEGRKLTSNLSKEYLSKILDEVR